MSYRTYSDISRNRQRGAKREFFIIVANVVGSGSVVGIATGYGLYGPGMESRGGRDFPLVHTVPGAHPASCKIGTGSFLGVKCGRGVLLTTHPPSSAAVMEE
jgi:hypothetical protein